MRKLYQFRFELKHLRAFLAVAEELNFHRAGERLGISQPAVSRMVKELEERLDTPLLNRTTRKTELTAAGVFLSEEARDILQRAEFAEATTRSFSTGKNALLRVSYMTLAGHALVPDIVQLFSKRHPEIRCELSYMTSPAQRRCLENGEINVGFIVGPFQETGIASKVVANHPLMVLLPGSHPLAAKEEISVLDLKDEPLILGSNDEWPTLRVIIDNVFEDAGLKPLVCQEASSLTGILGLVTTGLAPTIFCGVPRFCVEPAVVARPLIAPALTPVQSTMIWRKNRMTPALRRFIEATEEVAEFYR